MRLTEAESGDGSAANDTELEGVEHAARVAKICGLTIDRIERLETLDKRGEPMGRKLSFEIFTKLVGDVGHGIDATAQGVDIHHGATREKGQSPTLLENRRKDAQRLVLETESIERPTDRAAADKMVWGSGKLLFRRGGSADGHLGIDLTTIGRDDFAAKTFGDADRDFCLTYGRGARYDDKRIHPRLIETDRLYRADASDHA